MQVVFSEFHYTGNHVQGRNSGNYEDLEAWAEAAGLDLDNRDLFWDRLERIAGTHELRLGGRTLRYTVQVLRSERSGSFGRTYRRRYRLIECR